jgi:outer membrane protein
MKQKKNYSIIVLAFICVFFLGFIPPTGYSQGYNHVTVREVQKKLQKSGYDPGPIDGVWGKKTGIAIKKYQYDNELQATGRLDSATLKKLGLEEIKKRISVSSPKLPSREQPLKEPHLEVYRVGYLNLQRLVNESDMGKTAKQEIQKLRKEREAAINGKLVEINRLKELINNQGSTMSSDEKREKIEQLQKAYKEYQRMVADAKEDIEREERQLVSVILTEADSVLKKVAKKMRYTIILKDPNVIGYLDPSADITDHLLRELKKER